MLFANASAQSLCGKARRRAPDLALIFGFAHSLALLTDAGHMVTDAAAIAVALHEGVLPGYPASHGCIRLTNEDVIDLYKRVKTGTIVVVLDAAAPFAGHLPERLAPLLAPSTT